MIPRLLRSIADLIAPPQCCICKAPLLADETSICQLCLDKLPRTGYHRIPDSDFLQKLCAHDIPLDRATALLRYTPDSPVARTIIQFKYHNRQHLAIKLGELMAYELLSTGFLTGIDYLIPVPIHFTRRLKRGYNQSELLARGISNITRIPVATWLRATHSRSTQTRLTAEERRQNASKNRFRLRGAPDLTGKHLLLIDDVCTTGSTLRACLRALHDATARPAPPSPASAASSPFSAASSPSPVLFSVLTLASTH